MIQYEYKKIEYLFKEMSEEKLNERGAEGMIAPYKKMLEEAEKES